jgi:hypothetical protein
MSSPPAKRVQTTAAITDVNMAFAQSSFAKYRSSRINDPIKGCWIPDKVPRDDGYVRYSITAGSAAAAFGPGAAKKERTFYIHHLAFYATGHVMPERVNEHLSHLCGNSKCFNPAHLIVEDPKTNNARKNCMGAVRCPCPCQKAFWTCVHEPKCIAPLAMKAELDACAA